MKLVKPSFEILDTNGYDIAGIYKDIERAGRLCYKSEDRTTEDSAEKFVNALIKSGHTSVLEHGTVYLALPKDYKNSLGETGIKYSVNPHSKCIEHFPHYYITTSFRALQEHNWLDDLQYLCEPTEYHEKRVSVKFICSRSISHELVRHRVFSFSQESQRYCNYSKNRFGRNVVFCIPSWAKDIQTIKTMRDSVFDRTPPELDGTWGTYYTSKDEKTLIFIRNLNRTEDAYFDLLDMGCKPQEAREVLSNATKTEIIMTGTIEQWMGFFKLRADSHAHPDMQALAYPLKEEFIKRNYLSN